MNLLKYINSNIDYIENNNEEAINNFLEIELGGWALIHKTDNLTQVLTLEQIISIYFHYKLFLIYKFQHFYENYKVNQLFISIKQNVSKKKFF